jgi:hypothetical protein
VKYAIPGSIEEVWQQHSTRLTELQALGRLLRATTTFEDYVTLSRLEEKLLSGLAHQPLTAEAAGPTPANTRVFLLMVSLLSLIGIGLIVLLLLLLARMQS